MFSLSICADTVFLDLPFIERVKRIAANGFLVEFWNWRDREIDAIAADPQARVIAFTGYTKGCMVHPDGVKDFLAGIEETIPIAKKLRCTTLFMSSGHLNSEGQVAHSIASHPVTRSVTAYKTLCRIAELAERHNLTYTIEHLNTKVDHPGYPFAVVEDIVSLLSEVGSSRIKLLLDIYHAQIEEGNLVELIRKYSSYIGHVHVADVPGRHEPGTGEINYTYIAKVLRDIGYQGVVGLEAYPKDHDESALSRFREVFS
jgi:hydroxypyruvate isomerase